MSEKDIVKGLINKGFHTPLVGPLETIRRPPAPAKPDAKPEASKSQAQK